MINAVLLGLRFAVASAYALPGEQAGDVLTVEVASGGETVASYYGGRCSLGNGGVDAAGTPPTRAVWDVGSIWIPTLSGRHESATVEVSVFAGERSASETLRYIYPMAVRPIEYPMPDAIWLRRFSQLCEPWAFSRASWDWRFERLLRGGRSVLLRYWAEGLGIRVLRGGSQPTLIDPIPMLGLMRACERRRSGCAAFLDYAFAHLDG